jgi:branched-chain amino acid transport system ATP-binding protein
MADAILATRGLHKRFGGLVVTDDVALEVAPGETRALIGPNGAGKTTLVAQLSGSLAPDRGTILLRGRDVTGLAIDERVRMGLARSFQITSVFPRFTVLANALLTVQAHAGSSMRFWRPRAADSALRSEAERLLQEIGLEGRADVPAAALSHAEQRQLEVGLALAGGPAVVLLDEPMAGLGPDESGRMIALIERIQRRAAILLVEHDMDVVFRLAHTITVLVAGRILATGTPQEVRASADVRAAYLGEDGA